jgi:hypothetical protein
MMMKLMKITGKLQKKRRKKKILPKKKMKRKMKILKKNSLERKRKK